MPTFVGEARTHSTPYVGLFDSVSPPPSLSPWAASQLPLCRVVSAALDPAYSRRHVSPNLTAVPPARAPQPTKAKVALTLHFLVLVLCTSQDTLLRFTNQHGEVPCTGVECRTAASSRWGRPVRGRHPGALRCPVRLLHGACKRMAFLFPSFQYLFVHNITVTIRSLNNPASRLPYPHGERLCVPAHDA
jgi:hypothetical protein